MNQYINDWLEIIENMSNENTYKLAWGRAIIEICMDREIEDSITIHFYDIAHKMIKYYWNQTFFFNLKQSPNQNKKPVLVQNVEHLIEKYKELSLSNIPIWFDKAENTLNSDKNFYENIITTCSHKLKDDVSWRFLKANKKNMHYMS